MKIPSLMRWRLCRRSCEATGLWASAALAWTILVAVLTATVSGAQGALAGGEQGATLKPRIVEQDGFTVVGIEVRTNNAAAAAVIPKQWERFFHEELAAKIPNRTDSDLVVVYSGYAGDHRGDYDYLLGARAREGATAPAGMVSKVVPKARYAVLTTDQGPVGKVVSEKWRKIWDLEQSGGLGGRRTYKSDFEVYDQRSRDPHNSQVDIYIGIE